MKLVMLTSELSRRFGDKKALELIKDAGFDGYDYSMFDNVNDSIFNNDNYVEYAKNLRELSEQLNLPCLQAHAPSPLMRTIDQVLPLEPIFLRSIEVASILGCKIIVIHPGSFLTAKENKIHIYDKLLPYAQKLGVTIATENMFKWKEGMEEIETEPSACGTAKDFVEHIDLINHPNFTACLDIGHAEMVNCEGAVKIIKELGGDRLKALHVHDNDLFHDDHTTPFVGKINWVEVTRALKEIGYKGHFTFENSNFLKGFPNELIPQCLKLMEQSGRYLIKLIED
ncbi:MAG: sugar phosphate isomerase/epimerase [Clostridia bacterium]|nr:sugar phosphate isomerase/epimerase [Clostridia bacterium]